MQLCERRRFSFIAQTLLDRDVISGSAEAIFSIITKVEMARKNCHLKGQVQSKINLWTCNLQTG